MENVFFELIGVCFALSILLLALIFGRAETSWADRWLKFWFLAHAISTLLLVITLNTTGSINLIAASLNGAVYATIFPCFYLYARAIAGKDAPQPLWHFFLPLSRVFVDYWLYANFLLEDARPFLVITGAAKIIVAFSIPLISIVFIYYGFLSRRYIIERLRSAKSSADRQDLVWVKRWAVSSIIVATIHLGVFLSQFVTAYDLHTGAIIGLSVSAAQLIFFGYSGIRFTRYFRSGTKLPAPSEARESLDKEEQLSFLLALQESEAYLDPRISVEELSKRIGWPVEKILHVVDDGLKLGFPGAINQARTEHAKRLMHDPKNSEVRLLTLGYDSGFGSKSSFNAEFLKRTGLTPSAYRSKISYS